MAFPNRMLVLLMALLLMALLLMVTMVSAEIVVESVLESEQCNCTDLKERINKYEKQIDDLLQRQDDMIEREHRVSTLLGISASFYHNHGLLFLWAVTFFPRITLFAFSSLILTPSLVFLILTLPHISVAILSMPYWRTNPYLVAGAWIWALLAEYAEKKTLRFLFSRKIFRYYSLIKAIIVQIRQFFKLQQTMKDFMNQQQQQRQHAQVLYSTERTTRLHSTGSMEQTDRQIISALNGPTAPDETDYVPSSMDNNHLD